MGLRSNLQTPSTTKQNEWSNHRQALPWLGGEMVVMIARLTPIRASCACIEDRHVAWSRHGLRSFGWCQPSPAVRVATNHIGTVALNVEALLAVPSAVSWATAWLTHLAPEPLVGRLLCMDGARARVRRLHIRRTASRDWDGVHTVQKRTRELLHGCDKQIRYKKDFTRGVRVVSVDRVAADGATFEKSAHPPSPQP
jgi:hypothetical protein